MDVHQAGVGRVTVTPHVLEEDLAREHLARLAREADRETREFTVDVRVLELPKNWAVGQRAEVYIETARKGDVLVLPTGLVLWRDGKPGNEVDGPWQRTFLDCLKSNARPPVSRKESHQATACCHLANIAYRVGRSIQWDGAAETIAGDADAARLLSRPRRAGYELPKV